MDSPARTDSASTEMHWRDAVGLGLIVALFVLFLPTLGLDRGVLPGRASEQRALAVQEFVGAVIDRLASTYLPPALGFALVLRRRRLDLSVWTVFALGGVATAWCINRGAANYVALPLGVLAGAALGALSGLVATRTPIPSAVVTIGTGLLAMGLCAGLSPGRAVPVAEGAFQGWYLEVEVAVETGNGASDPSPSTPASAIRERRPAPPAVTRMLIAACGYAATMAVLIAGRKRRRPPAVDPREPRSLNFAAFVASGALAALGGAAWLVEQNSAPAATQLVGDLRIPAATLLAGALLLCGPGRTLLMGLCLPAALVVATVWRQELTRPVLLRSWGYVASSAVLALMVLSIHFGLIWWRGMSGGRRRPAAGLWMLAVAGTLVTASQSAWSSYAVRHVLHEVGLLAWGLGAAGLLAFRLAGALREGPSPSPCPDPPDRDPA